MKTLLSFGHGYSARALAPLLLDRGWRVVGTSRDPRKRAQPGVEMCRFPGDDIADDLQAATHILVSAGPDADGDPVLRELGQEIARHRYDWVGYLSTTGVYGDHGGGWVDETTPVAPTTRRGRWRAQAETNWQALDLPLHIFRLAGIYGPGRGPFAKVRAGTARRIVKPGQVFSRIHVEDIAQVLAASIERPNPGAIYNLCDDDPAPPQDVIGFAAGLLGVEPPPTEDFATAEMTAMARSFYAENKRVRNDRIKSELGIRLRYPDYRAGLRDLLARDTAGQQD